VNRVKYSAGAKIFLALLGLYTLFFIAGGILTPIFAHFRNFEAAGALYEILGRSCQQDALRSFWITGYQMAVCARCFGAYIGFLTSIILALSGRQFSKTMFIVFAVLALGEKAAEFVGFAGNNYIRLISGCFLGCFLFIIPLLAIKIFKGVKDV
jgi:uncharacterized membrane protein